MTRRLRLFAVLLAFMAAFPWSAAAAELALAWPGKDVTVVLPFAPGNESDLYWVLMREPFAETTGRELILRNVAGEGGAQAWARMVDDEPDGYSLTSINLPHVFLRTLQRDSGVDPASMRVCGVFTYTPCVLWAPKDGPDLNAFIAEARKTPGRPLVAGPGRYSAAQMAARMLDRSAGIRTTFIPYAGTAEAANAVRNGDAKLFWGHTVALPAFRNLYRPLAVAAEKRDPALPGTPTFLELGYEVVEGMYQGVAVPANTPEKTREEIGQTLTALAASPAVRVKAAMRGYSTVDIPYKTIPAFLAAQREKALEMAEDFGLSKQD